MGHVEFELTTTEYRPNTFFERANQLMMSSCNRTQLSTVTLISTSLAIAFNSCHIDRKYDRKCVEESIDMVFTTKGILGVTAKSQLEQYLNK